jgi:hypothetical protein
MYVDGNPTNWSDPLGLIKWKYNTSTSTHPMAFKNGCTSFKFALDHGSKNDGCGSWKLEFSAEASFHIYLNAALSKAKAAQVLEHENEHVSTAVNNVLSGLATLLPYEKPTYESEKDCEDAAQRALNALKLNANKGQAGVDDYVGYLVGKAMMVRCP